MTLWTDIDPPPDVSGLSADRKRTIRNRYLLENNTHPTTKLPLLGNGETCGSCDHHFIRRLSRIYHKCEMVEATGGPASDVRVGWPACVKWVPVEDDAGVKP